MSFRLSPETLSGWSPALLSAGLLVLTLIHHLVDTRVVEPEIGGQAPPPEVAGPLQAPADLERVVAWSLFGKVAPTDEAGSKSGEAQLPPQTVLPEDDENTVLPPSNLDLKLQGIAYSRDKTRAYAILEFEGGAPREYRPGDPLKDGLELRAIRPLEVVILNQGRLESVALPVAPAPMTQDVDSTTIPAEPSTGRNTPFSILRGSRPPEGWRRLDSLRGARQRKRE